MSTATVSADPPVIPTSSQDLSQIGNVLKGARSIAEQGGVLSLMVVGLILTVLPTIAIFSDVWSTPQISLGLYIAALVAGGGAMVTGGLLAFVTETSIRRETLEVFRSQASAAERYVGLAEKMWEGMNENEKEARTAVANFALEVGKMLSSSYLLGPGPKKSQGI